MALSDNPPDSNVVMERYFRVVEAEKAVGVSQRTIWLMRSGIRSKINGEIIYLRWARRTGVGVVTSIEAMEEFDYQLQLPKEEVAARKRGGKKSQSQ